MERLLDMVSDTTRQLQTSQQTQRELQARVADTQAALDKATEKCDDVEAHLKQETEAKEYLTVELNKAEGSQPPSHLVAFSVTSISGCTWTFHRVSHAYLFQCCFCDC